MKVLLRALSGTESLLDSLSEVSDDTDFGQMLESYRQVLESNGYEPSRIEILDSTGETLADLNLM
jgi:hypothetical protein